MIDYITSTAGFNKIFYVGHSQGTSQFFAMTATKPSYNKKIALMSALAPVAHMNHMASPLLVPLAKNINVVQVSISRTYTLGNALINYWETLEHNIFMSVALPVNRK